MMWASLVMSHLKWMQNHNKGKENLKHKKTHDKNGP
jgi:hypothetical protein